MSQGSNRSIPYLQYFVSSVHMRNDVMQKNQSKCQSKTNRSEKTFNNHLTIELTGLGEQVPTFPRNGFKRFRFYTFYECCL